MWNSGHVTDITQVVTTRKTISHHEALCVLRGDKAFQESNELPGASFSALAAAINFENTPPDEQISDDRLSDDSPQ